MLGKKKQRAKQREQKQKPKYNTWPMYILLIALFVAYLFFQSMPGLAIILGALIFVIIIVILVMELSLSVKQEGYKKNIFDVAIAIALVLIFWFGLQFALGTPNPLNVVPSCSMLPTLQRGDMILIQGININSVKAPIISVPTSTWNGTISNFQSESLECVAYNITGNQFTISQFLSKGYQIGLFRSSNYGGQIVPNSAQSNNLIKYTCGAVNVKFSNGTVKQEASTTAIAIGNTTITGDANNTVVVYQTVPNDLFYKEGDSYVVHRVYAVINASGKYYFLTKGDNNPGLDVQYFNYPANESQISGKVIADIPYMGYLKLILSNSFVEPTGCNYTTE